MKSNRRWGVGLFILFAAQLIYAATFLWRTHGGFLEGAPQDFVDIMAAARAFNWGLAAFAAIGSAAAIAICWNLRAGWIILASLLTVTSAWLAFVRLSTAPRYVFDADWGNVGALAIFAAFAWRRCTDERRLAS